MHFFLADAANYGLEPQISIWVQSKRGGLLVYRACLVADGEDSKSVFPLGFTKNQGRSCFHTQSYLRMSLRPELVLSFGIHAANIGNIVLIYRS